MADYSKYQGSGVFDWSKAYVAAPRFYQKPDGGMLGAFAVNEGIETILPAAPHLTYRADGMIVRDWRLLLYSKTKQDVIGDVDFYDAMQILREYLIDGNDEKVLLKALSLTELDALYRRLGNR